MATWRYIVQRATTGEFLDLEAPFVTRSELSWALSAAGSFKGTIEVERGSMKAQDGRPMFEEWNTIIYAEADGQIRWGGIVVTSELSSDGKSWDIEAASFATYPKGIPYLGAYYGVQVDPADVIREIWSHIQGFDGGNLGVTVTGSTSVRVGSTSEQKYNAAAATYKSLQAAYEDEKDKYTDLRKYATGRGNVRTALSTAKTNASKTLSAAKSALTAAKKTKDPAKIAAAQTAVNNAQSAYNSALSNYNAAVSNYKDADAAADAQDKVRDAAKAKADAAKKTMDAAKKVMDADGGAYKMLWWETPDTGDKIKSLASETPLDYTETHAWNDDKTAITHRVNVQYPRAGRRRDDLKFVQGDNVTAVPIPKSNGDSFANSVFVTGAGEGKSMKQTSAAVNDGRLRRVDVIAAKNVKNLDTLRAMARDGLLAGKLTLSFDQIDVRNHDNARIGSWALGDDILVEADVPFLGRVSIWHRVIGWSLTSDSTARITLARSDSFTYGK